MELLKQCPTLLEEPWQIYCVFCLVLKKVFDKAGCLVISEYSSVLQVTLKEIKMFLCKMFPPGLKWGRLKLKDSLIIWTWNSSMKVQIQCLGMWFKQIDWGIPPHRENIFPCTCSNRLLPYFCKSVVLNKNGVSHSVL